MVDNQNQSQVSVLIHHCCYALLWLKWAPIGFDQTTGTGTYGTTNAQKVKLESSSAKYFLVFLHKK